MSRSGKSSNPAEPAKAPPGFVSGPDTGGPDTGVSGSDGAQGGELLTIEPEAVERIERLAAEYLDSIVSLAAGSFEYTRAIDAIDHLGERDFIATAAMSGRVLDRRFEAMRGLLAGKAPLARRLADLRKTAAGLDPEKLRLTAGGSGHAQLRALDRYIEQFEKSRPRLDELLGALTEGRYSLEQDNAAVVTEQSSLAMEMETLRQYAYLARRLDEDLAVVMAGMAASDANRAAALRLDVQPVVKRRREEILTQLAIVTQGYAALRIVEERNAEVIRAVGQAITTTTAALRTAAMVAGAAASQHAALEQLEAAREAASTMADRAAALEEASGPAGRLALLREAWSEVYAALDRVDFEKAEVLRTISLADRELTRPKVGAPDGHGGSVSNQE